MNADGEHVAFRHDASKHLFGETGRGMMGFSGRLLAALLLVGLATGQAHAQPRLTQTLEATQEATPDVTAEMIRKSIRRGAYRDALNPDSKRVQLCADASAVMSQLAEEPPQYTLDPKSVLPSDWVVRAIWSACKFGNLVIDPVDNIKRATVTEGLCDTWRPLLNWNIENLLYVLRPREAAILCVYFDEDIEIPDYNGRFLRLDNIGAHEINVSDIRSSLQLRINGSAISTLSISDSKLDDVTAQNSRISRLNIVGSEIVRTVDLQSMTMDEPANWLGEDPHPEPQLSIIRSTVGSIRAADLTGASVKLEATSFNGMDFSKSNIEKLGLVDVKVARMADFRAARIRLFSGEYSEIGTDLRADKIVASSFSLTDTKIAGDLVLNDAQLAVPPLLPSCKDVIKAARDNLATAPRGLRSSARVLNLDRLKIAGDLIARGITVDGHSNLTSINVDGVSANGSCWLGIVHMPDLQVAKGFDATGMVLLPAADFSGNVWQAYGLQAGSYVALTNAVIGGPANLYRAVIEGGFYAEDSVWEKDLVMNNASVGGTLEFGKAVFKAGLTARDIIVKSHIVFTNVTANGDLYLRNAQVGGHVELNNAKQLKRVDFRYATIGLSIYGERIIRWDGALDLEASKVGREVFFDDVAHWAGFASFSYGTFGSRIYFEDIHFKRPDYCRDGQLHCHNITLAYAKVDGPFELVYSTVPERIWAANASFKGEVNLSGSLLHGTANFMQSSFTNLRGVPDACRFAVPSPRPANEGPGPEHKAGSNDRKLALSVAGKGTGGGRLQLAGARFDYAMLDADVVRAFDPATASRITKGDAFAPIEIAGAVYGLRGPAPCHAPPPGSEAKADGPSAPGTDFFNGDISLVTRWLNSEQVNPGAGDRPFKGMQVINAQPYEVLARNLNEAGRRQEADDILQAKFDRRVEAESPWKTDKIESGDRVKFLSHSLWWGFIATAGYVINYGLSNERAFLWWLGLVGIGMFVRLGFRDMLSNAIANLLSPGRSRPTVPRFLLMCRPKTARQFRHECNSWYTQGYHAFLYSMAMAVPIVSDLFKPTARFAYTAPNKGRYLGPVEAPTYFLFHKLLAFVLITLTVAGVAGLIK